MHDTLHDLELLDLPMSAWFFWSRHTIAFWAQKDKGTVLFPLAWLTDDSYPKPVLQYLMSLLKRNRVGFCHSAVLCNVCWESMPPTVNLICKLNFVSIQVKFKILTVCEIWLNKSLLIRIIFDYKFESKV